MKIINMLFLSLLFLINCSVISGHDSLKDLSKVTAPDARYDNIFVYLHTDRSYYLPGESVFFKAYFLDGLNNRSYPINDTLQVTLLDQDGLEITSGVYPVTNNLLTGKIELPDFLTEGNYILIAYTRQIITLSPEETFSRVIEIRKSIEDDLITDLSLSDSLYEPAGILAANIRFSGKENRPVSANYNYQLKGMSGEILSGKGKADSEGMSSLSLKLPAFDSKENMKLLVAPSYKGTNTITGIVIPTRFNYAGGKKLRDRNFSTKEFKHLNIQLKTVNLSNEKNNEIRLDISVTDENGAPVMANLSVSASNLITHQLFFENDNISSYINRKSNSPATNSNIDIRKYFVEYLLQITRSPGIQFIVQEKNNPKKLTKKGGSADQKSQVGYSSDRNIFDILMQIKPYRLENGKITFGINAVNSLNSLDGALIIVDGIKMGTDASILNSIPVPDIARITASTNVLDIQRYSALNGNGIIEIFMKKNSAFVKDDKTSGRSKNNTLFWGPDIITDSAGKASASFLNNIHSSEILISVQGIAANGLCGSSSIQYSVK